MPRTTTPETFTRAAHAAVALMTRRQLAPEVPREVVLGDVPPGEALEAMELIAAGILRGVWPADDGAAFLDRLGVTIALLGGD